METLVGSIQFAAIVVFVLSMAYAAISDLRAFEIPNWLHPVIALGFLVLVFLDGRSWSHYLDNFLTGGVVLLAGFVLFALRIIGAGDVKLLTVISLWMGWPHFLAYFVLVTLAGGLLSLFLIVFRRYSLAKILTRSGWISRLHARKGDVPYGVAIALPALLYLPRIPLVAGIIS